MQDPLGDYLRWLDQHGVKFEVAPTLWQDEDQNGPRVSGSDPVVPIELEGLAPFVEHRDPERGLAADHATIMVARTLLRANLFPRAGRVWDIGCGTGVLAVTAGLAGARVVVATDVDPDALALARRTASESNVAVQFFEGAGIAAVPAPGQADLVIANLPHKPVPDDARLPIAQAGGEHGDSVHATCAREAGARLAAGASVCFFLHSLPTPRLLGGYAEQFRLRLLSWKRRFLWPGEYGPLDDHFLARAERGESFVVRSEKSEPFLVAGVWQAVRW